MNFLLLGIISIIIMLFIVFYDIGKNGVPELIDYEIYSVTNDSVFLKSYKKEIIELIRPCNELVSISEVNDFLKGNNTIITLYKSDKGEYTRINY